MLFLREPVEISMEILLFRYDTNDSYTDLFRESGYLYSYSINALTGHWLIAQMNTRGLFTTIFFLSVLSVKVQCYAGAFQNKYPPGI